MEIDFLFEKVKKLKYPEFMIQVCDEINGRAFFPVGKGTFNCDHLISNKKIMVLGQDFDCEKNYLPMKENIKTNATWRNLLKFLDEAGIDREDCFFTNSIMGIRRGSKGTGKSPAFKDKLFIGECRELLRDQIKLQSPKLILVLGKYVAEFISGLSAYLDCWKHIQNFAFVDQEGNQVRTIELPDSNKCSLVLLTHPSYRYANVGKRRYADFIGQDAELNMVRDALFASA
jgi:uracil-DNA glycosylase